MSKEIKVAKIIDPFTLILNAGSDNGLVEGNVVMIYDLGEPILDPDTQENLGTLEIVKGTGVVSHVQPKIATVESNMKEDAATKIVREPVPGAFGGLEKIFGSRTEEIPLKKKAFSEPKIGSLVKVIR